LARLLAGVVDERTSPRPLGRSWAVNNFENFDPAP
jgi:hypothetical protein